MDPQQWQFKSYLISSSQALLQPQPINDAFGSDMIFWANREPVERLERMLKDSWCIGIYALDDGTVGADTDMLNLPEAKKKALKQIGLARLITDYTSIAYLTDTYILPPYQGQAIMSFVLGKINETLVSWPSCRRLVLLAEGERTKKYYRELLGVEVMQGGELELMSRTYAGWGVH